MLGNKDCVDLPVNTPEQGVKVQKSDQTGDWTQDLLDIYQML